ncbi:MAG: hypothetical protein OEY74_04560 [Gammaproteobacteria bacterium]|nr:hypothetical protein [Gammaproteobacteria bacterium]
MGKNIAAGVIGVFVAVGLVWLIEMIGHAVYPPPPDIDFSDVDAVRHYLSTLPLGAFAFVGGAWFLGTLGGTMAASRIGSAAPRLFAMVVGGFVLAATAFNLAVIPHPLWFSIVGVAGILVAAWLGQFLSTRRTAE